MCPSYHSHQLEVRCSASLGKLAHAPGHSARNDFLRALALWLTHAPGHSAHTDFGELSLYKGRSIRYVLPAGVLCLVCVVFVGFRVCVLCVCVGIPVVCSSLPALTGCLPFVFGFLVVTASCFFPLPVVRPSLHPSFSFPGPLCPSLPPYCISSITPVG